MINHTTIRAIRKHLPSSMMANERLVPEVSWSADETLPKNRFAERRNIDPNESASDLAFGTASRLMAEENIDPLILCTQAPDHLMPSSACLVHAALGLAARCAAADINQGYFGYTYALASGLARRGLAVAADTNSKLIHLGDRWLRTLYGDGAVATQFAFFVPA